MDKDKIVEIVEDVENRSNKDLLSTATELEVEFNKTKDLIISLTRHLETIEKLYDKVSKEIEKRKAK
jgi:hypothetical protein